MENMTETKDKKRILLGACNYWNAPFQVGSHHIAREFSKLGWETLFISDPVTPFHLLKLYEKEIIERFQSSLNSIQYEDGIYNHVPFSLIAPYTLGILKSKLIYRNWYKFTFPNILKLIKQYNFDYVDLLYIDSIYQHYLLDKINYKKAIFRIADDNRGFRKYNSNYEHFMKKIIMNVDYVVYTAKNLESFIHKFNPKDTIYLPNGVNIDNFKDMNYELPVEFKKIEKPIVVYVGAIKEWFDFEAVQYAAKILTDYVFVIIGNIELANKYLGKISNIYLLGPKKYNEIPAYLYHSNCGIIPFNVNQYGKLINSVNPLKLYEYMLCGLPVVASRWDELEIINSPALLYDNYDEFVEKIRYAVTTNFDKNTFINFAKQHSWREKIIKILDYIK